MKIPRSSTGIVPCALLVLLAAPLPARAQDADAPPATVSSVDLDRYAGRWYEVARFPNRFQKQCVGDVVAEYTPREDGRIEVVNRCRRADGTVDVARGVARPASDDGSNAKLEVRFAPAWLSFLPVWGDYWVIALAPDYSHAVVGDRDREYLWLLSRTPVVSDDLFVEMKGKAAEQGYGVSKLQRTVNTPQTAEDPHP